MEHIGADSFATLSVACEMVVLHNFTMWIEQCVCLISCVHISRSLRQGRLGQGLGHRAVVSVFQSLLSTSL